MIFSILLSRNRDIKTILTKYMNTMLNDFLLRNKYNITLTLFQKLLIFFVVSLIVTTSVIVLLSKGEKNQFKKKKIEYDIKQQNQNEKDEKSKDNKNEQKDKEELEQNDEEKIFSPHMRFEDPTKKKIKDQFNFNTGKKQEGLSDTKLKDGQIQEKNEKNKVIFDGMYKDGAKNGQGTRVNYGIDDKSTHVSFVKNYVDNIANGEGFFSSKISEDKQKTVKGNFVNGVIEGKGQIVIGDNVYKGNISDNIPNGEGEEYYKGNLVFQGTYANGKRLYGKSYEDGFVVHEGAWLNGKKYGIGKEYQKDLVDHDGNLIKDAEIARGVYENDVLKEGTVYEHSAYPHSVGVDQPKYYMSKKCEVTRSKKNGIEVEYDEFGRVTAKRRYENGEQVGDEISIKYNNPNGPNGKTKDVEITLKKVGDDDFLQVFRGDIKHEINDNLDEIEMKYDDFEKGEFFDKERKFYANGNYRGGGSVDGFLVKDPILPDDALPASKEVMLEPACKCKETYLGKFKIANFDNTNSDINIGSGGGDFFLKSQLDGTDQEKTKVSIVNPNDSEQKIEFSGYLKSKFDSNDYRAIIGNDNNPVAYDKIQNYLRKNKLATGTLKSCYKDKDNSDNDIKSICFVKGDFDNNGKVYLSQESIDGSKATQYQNVRITVSENGNKVKCEGEVGDDNKPVDKIVHDIKDGFVYSWSCDATGKTNGGDENKIEDFKISKITNGSTEEEGDNCRIKLKYSDLTDAFNASEQGFVCSNKYNYFMNKIDKGTITTQSGSKTFSKQCLGDNENFELLEKTYSDGSVNDINLIKRFGIVDENNNLTDGVEINYIEPDNLVDDYGISVSLFKNGNVVESMEVPQMYVTTITDILTNGLDKENKYVFFEDFEKKLSSMDFQNKTNGFDDDDDLVADMNFLKKKFSKEDNDSFYQKCDFKTNLLDGNLDRNFIVEQIGKIFDAIKRQVIGFGKYSNKNYSEDKLHNTEIQVKGLMDFNLHDIFYSKDGYYFDFDLLNQSDVNDSGYKNNTVDKKYKYMFFQPLSDEKLEIVLKTEDTSDFDVGDGVVNGKSTQDIKITLDKDCTLNVQFEKTFVKKNDNPDDPNNNHVSDVTITIKPTNNNSDDAIEKNQQDMIKIIAKIIKLARNKGCNNDLFKTIFRKHLIKDYQLEIKNKNTNPDSEIIFTGEIHEGKQISWNSPALFEIKEKNKNDESGKIMQMISDKKKLFINIYDVDKDGKQTKNSQISQISSLINDKEDSMKRFEYIIGTLSDNNFLKRRLEVFLNKANDLFDESLRQKIEPEDQDNVEDEYNIKTINGENLDVHLNDIPKVSLDNLHNDLLTYVTNSK